MRAWSVVVDAGGLRSGLSSWAKFSRQLTNPVSITARLGYLMRHVPRRRQLVMTMPLAR